MGRATLPEASRYVDTEYMKLFLKLQKVFFHDGVQPSWQFTPNYSRKRREKKKNKTPLQMKSESPSRCAYSDSWDIKLASPQTQFQAFVFPQRPKRPVTHQPPGWQMAKAAEPPGSLLTGFGSAWEGQRCHLSSLALQRPEDTTQLLCKDRKVISGRSLGNVFMCVHARSSTRCACYIERMS